MKQGNTNLGIDLALNHSGFVLLDGDGEMTWWYYVSDVSKHVPSGCDYAALMPHSKGKKGEDRETVNARRLDWWSHQLPFLVTHVQPTHVGIEDYAISAQSNSAYQIGEVGGLARLAALKAGAKVRLHDPMTVKMFGAHAGNAQPETVAAEVRERWPETQVWDVLADVPRIDLACAYVVARMVFVETKLRDGTMKLSDLDHEKEIAVFQRATKANPISLLGRDWIVL